ncbi:MAG: hypothetical protein IIA40_06520 [SAR324 cluster bacterium]|nr:hypothetical protein [SAR324 cluster bacterium]
MTATVTPASLKRMLHDGQELALLDVREEGQFALPAVTNPPIFSRSRGAAVHSAMGPHGIRRRASMRPAPFLCTKSL